MEPNPQEDFDLSLGTVVLGYDPLAGLEDEDEGIDDSGGQQKPLTGYQGKALYAPASAARPAAQRIEELFAALAPRRRVLLAILRLLDSPKRSDLLQQKVEELQEYDSSVYSGYNFSLLLEEAGAIQKVDESGAVFDEQAEQLPDIVEVEGIKFFKPTDGKQVFWLITNDGRSYLEGDNPFGRLAELIAKEPQYQEIYQKLLLFCANGAGRSVKELEELIDDDPLVQKPRRYFSYFTKNLEDCDALSWAKKWQTTELGEKGLELLFAENDGVEFAENGGVEASGRAGDRAEGQAGDKAGQPMGVEQL